MTGKALNDNQALPLLDQVNSVSDLRELPEEKLGTLCKELREYLCQTITRQGGHLAASLGAVELTIALHRVYNTPVDKIVWDVGHQTYVHKILTGRKEEFQHVRQFGGISGFPRREESESDTFGTGHASTSISAALGVATARDLHEDDYKVVAVIGDGGMTGGLAFEGLNNAGASGRDITVVLNDNQMSISPNVGAIAKLLARMETNPLLGRVKDDVWQLLGKLPWGAKQARELAGKLEGSLKNLLVPGMLFEDLGFQYFGPFDGHNITELVEIFKKVQSHKHPVLVHIITKKGKGFNPAEENPTKYHGVSVAPQKSAKESAPSRSYTDIFADAMLKEAEQKSNVVAITAAMAEGTGLVPFQERFPERFFDVGIAEGHAVTFAAGLATGGLRPVCAIYSTFLQRAFDHVIHDVAIQKLPVVFAVDRAGLVGEDGPTHHGVFDLTYLSTIPNMVVAAPKDGRELRSLLHTALEWKHGPFAIRFPRAKVSDKIQGHVPRVLPVGIWEQLREGSDIAILAVGSMVNTAMDAAKELEDEGVNVTLINCRYVKPIDEEMLQNLRSSHRLLISIEENAGIGGFASILARALAHQPGGARLFSLHLPDRFIEHGARSKLLEQVGLSTESIKKIIYLLTTGGKSLDLEKFAASYDVVAATPDGFVQAIKERA